MGSAGHPLATLLTITATANHYWADSIVALAIFAAALRLTQRTPHSIATNALL